MKTIVHIVNTGVFSGAERVVLQIITGMRKKKNIRSIYVGLNGKIENILEENQVEFFAIKGNTVSEIRRMVSSIKPDLIHAHDFTASFIASLCVWNIPIICHIHNNPPWIKQKGFKSFCFFFTIKRSRKVLLVSKSILREYCFKNSLRKKANIIGNPLDLQEIQRKVELSRKKEYDIIYVGRLSEQKNPLRFIDIIERIKANLPDLSVIMVGDGELEEECRKKIKKKKLEKTIEMKGFILNPYHLMSASKILCMTSEWEGFGLVVFEAYACQIPVVGSPVGGLKDLINDTCGKLCNTDEDYEKEITALLQDKEYWEKKVQGAKRMAEKLDNKDRYIENIYKKYVKILEEK